MKNFFQLASCIDTLQLRHQLRLRDDLWNANGLRTAYELGDVKSPHREADDIWLHFQPEKGEGFDIDEHECIPFPAWHALPAARAMIFALMRQVEGTRLGRVVITRLKPGAQIYPHADGGSPATYYERHQIALQALPGVTFTCGGEAIEQRTGDAWWFDNTKEHRVVNNSADDRIVMIVDVRCAR